MPRRAYGHDQEYEMLRLALMEQAQNAAPGRVPSGIAHNAYLSSMSPTFEQEREGDVLEEMDRRYFQTREEDRKRQGQIKDRHMDATVRNFETRTGRGRFTPVGTEQDGVFTPNPEPRTAPRAFNVENFGPVASHEQPNQPKLRQITRGPSAAPESTRNSNSAFTDPDMAMGMRDRARLDPRVLAEETRTAGDVAIANAKGAAQPPASYSDERAFRNLQSVRDLTGRVGMLTAGPGSMLSAIPGTDARDFAADLNTLKANIAFGELAAMREASKTGGALGAVSEKEMALLEAALGALDAGQSPTNLQKNLRQVEESINRWNTARGGATRPGAGGAEFDFIPGRGLVPRGGAR